MDLRAHAAFIDVCRAPGKLASYFDLVFLINISRQVGRGLLWSQGESHRR